MSKPVVGIPDTPEMPEACREVARGMGVYAKPDGLVVSLKLQDRPKMAVTLPWAAVLSSVPDGDAAQVYPIDAPGQLVFDRVVPPIEAALIREGDTVIVVRGPGWKP